MKKPNVFEYFSQVLLCADGKIILSKIYLSSVPQIVNLKHKSIP